MREIKINSDLAKGRIVELYPKIYVFEIPDLYELTMLFCKHQEFYESHFDDIRGKNFTLEYYMNKYRLNNKERVFTYPKDWIGFNIPSNSLENSLETFYLNSNLNDYDKILSSHLSSMLGKHVPPKYYVIGVKSIDDISTLNHELCHALYYTNEEFKKNSIELVEQIDTKNLKSICDTIISIGYSDNKDLLYDEINAYFSTGLNPRLERAISEEIAKELTLKFESNFNKFKNEIK